MKIRKAIRPTFTPETDWDKVPNGSIVKARYDEREQPDFLVCWYEHKSVKYFTLLPVQKEHSHIVFCNRSNKNYLPKLAGIYTDVTLILK